MSKTNSSANLYNKRQTKKNWKKLWNARLKEINNQWREIAAECEKEFLFGKEGKKIFDEIEDKKDE